MTQQNASRAANIKRDLERGIAFFDGEGNMWTLNSAGQGQDMMGSVIPIEELHKKIDDYCTAN